MGALLSSADVYARKQMCRVPESGGAAVYLKGARTNVSVPDDWQVTAMMQRGLHWRACACNSSGVRVSREVHKWPLALHAPMHCCVGPPAGSPCSGGVVQAPVHRGTQGRTNTCPGGQRPERAEGFSLERKIAPSQLQSVLT
jgi:hypothetical protein